MAASIIAFRPVVVTLNEVCWHQVEALDRKLLTDLYPMEVRFKETVSGLLSTESGNDCLYGIAILTAGKGSIVDNPEHPGQPDFRRLETPSSVPEKRTLACVDALVPVKVRGCVTHLVNGHDPELVDRRQTQVIEVAGFVQPNVDREEPVMIGGDFNVTPFGETPAENMLDHLYVWGPGPGDFEEVEASRAQCSNLNDSCQPTFYEHSLQIWQKFDYIFVDRNHWASLRADPSPATVSDHRLLKGYAVFR